MTESPIQSIVDKYKTKIEHSKIFFVPEIPANKLEDAIDKFANGAESENILCLIDASILDNNVDNGVLITDTKLFAKVSFGSNLSIPFVEIRKVEFIEESGLSSERKFGDSAKRRINSEI